MERPVRLQLFYVTRPHFGVYSGMQQFVSRMEPGRVDRRMRSVSDSDADFPDRPPWRWRPVRRALNSLIHRSGQRWYKLSDLRAEWETIGAWWRGEMDLLHFLDGEHTAQFLPQLAAAFPSKPRTIATFHQPAAVLPSVFPHRSARSLDHAVMVSASQLAYFRDVLPEGRLSVVPYGIDVDFFHPADGEPRTQTVRCLTSGSYLRDWKLFGEIVRALEGRCDVAFDVVSSSAPEIPGVSSVTVHRSITDDRLRSLYHQADILVLPLLDATANNALLEGMACGVPIVASDLPAVREYAADSCALFVPNRPENFVDAIEALAGDASRRARMGKAGRQRSLSFSWPSIARRYEDLYTRLARERQA